MPRKPRVEYEGAVYHILSIEPKVVKFEEIERGKPAFREVTDAGLPVRCAGSGTSEGGGESTLRETRGVC
jgi:hypothetical protein